MSRRRPTAAPAHRAAPEAGFRTVDGVQNAAARLGLGTDNISSASVYAYTTITRNRQNLDNAYRGAWLVGVAVDSVADDMTRAGIEILGDMDPGDIEAIQGAFVQLSLWNQLGDTVRWARLYGGCIAVMLIDGQNPETPLRIDTIRPGQFRGLLVMDRWMVMPSLDQVETEFGPNLGQPVFYTVSASQQGGTGATQGTVSGVKADSTVHNATRIHYSRVIRLDGNALPFYARQAEQGWGQSVIERLYDRLLAYDSATAGAAQLVYKAHLRVLKFKDYRLAVASGGRALEGIKAQIDLIRLMQTSDGFTALDADDTFEAHSYSFAGLPELLKQFAEQLSGALGIPIVRLFGQSPAGFSTGDADLANYETMIRAQQESKLRRPMQRLLDVVSRSCLGKPLPDGFNFRFTALSGMSPADQADVAGKVTTAVVSALDAGLLSPRTAMQELRQSSHVTGIFTNISDEDVDAADTEPPKPGEGGPGMPGDETQAAPGDGQRTADEAPTDDNPAEAPAVVVAKPGTEPADHVGDDEAPADGAAQTP